MPRDQLSPGFVSAMMGRETGVVVLFLLEIDHDDLDAPIRIVNNTEDVLSGGNLYTAMGFDLKLPESKEGTPRGAQISIDNTTQWFTPTIRSLQGQFLVTIRVAIPTDALASPPVYDGMEIEYLPMQLVSLQYDDTTVQGTLSYENLANQPYPGDSFNPFEFQGALLMDVSQYIGIPFREHGRDRNGVDCYGLVRVVMAEVYGVATRDYTDYRSNRPKDCAHLIRGERRDTEWVKVPNPECGDVVILNILGMPAHCGIYVGSGDFLHASHEAGVCLERLSAPLWARRIAGFYRHRERVNG